MIVVADVFSNGSASLADVVQAPRDQRMLADFEVALRQRRGLCSRLTGSPARHDARRLHRAKGRRARSKFLIAIRVTSANLQVCTSLAHRSTQSDVLLSALTSLDAPHFAC